MREGTSFVVGERFWYNSIVGVVVNLWYFSLRSEIFIAHLIISWHCNDRFLVIYLFIFHPFWALPIAFFDKWQDGRCWCWGLSSIVMGVFFDVFCNLVIVCLVRWSCPYFTKGRWIEDRRKAKFVMNSKGMFWLSFSHAWLIPSTLWLCQNLPWSVCSLSQIITKIISFFITTSVTSLNSKSK